jgi:hypothetical protein
MTTPTPADIATWPLPNYVDPDTRAGLVLGIEIPFTVVAVLIVGGRMVSPIFTQRTHGLEDWFIAFACVSHPSQHQ